MGFLIVFLGGGIGAALRHGFNLAFARTLGTSFPMRCCLRTYPARS
jgi:fluoride exporter